MKNNFVNQILCGDALSKLQELPSATVNCCVTSPPYYGLRDKVAQQYGRNFIGIELNPEYVAMANKRLENNQLKIPEVG